MTSIIALRVATAATGALALVCGLVAPAFASTTYGPTYSTPGNGYGGYATPMSSGQSGYFNSCGSRFNPDRISCEWNIIDSLPTYSQNPYGSYGGNPYSNNYNSYNQYPSNSYGYGYPGNNYGGGQQYPSYGGYNQYPSYGYNNGSYNSYSGYNYNYQYQYSYPI